jgi:hypothetical protein
VWAVDLQGLHGEMTTPMLPCFAVKKDERVSSEEYVHQTASYELIFCIQFSLAHIHACMQYMINCEV